MATNTILTTIAHIVTCGPCGRWKEELQDDDADLWKDLTLANAVPEMKPPTIPKVVKVISVQDGSDDDLSTLAYDSYTNPSHSKSHSRGQTVRTGSCHTAPIEEEKSFSPSPKRSRSRHSADYAHTKRYDEECDLELEQVLEEIGREDDECDHETRRDRRCSSHHDGGGDAELESIMGPRSQISASSRARSHVSVTSRSIKRRAASDSACAMAPSSAIQRQSSVLQQQQREQYHCTYAAVVTESKAAFDPAGSGSNGKPMIASTTGSQEDSKEEQQELEFPDSFEDDVLGSSWSYNEDRNKEGDYHQQNDEEEEDDDDYAHDDGSSYSSVRHKLSFFRKNGKRSSFFRNRSSGSSSYSHKNKGGRESEDWLLASEQGGSSTDDTYSTVQTQNCSCTYRSHASHRSGGSHNAHNKYKPIF